MREDLAASIYEMRQNWVRHLLGSCTRDRRGWLTIPPHLESCLKRQIATQYQLLADPEKDFYRRRADTVVETLHRCGFIIKNSRRFTMKEELDRFIKYDLPHVATKVAMGIIVTLVLCGIIVSGAHVVGKLFASEWLLALAWCLPLGALLGAFAYIAAR